MLAQEVRQRGGDGAIFGHILHAEMRTIGDILYCNDGDRTESCTALVEHFDGQLEILQGGTLSRFKRRAAELATAS